MCLKSQFLSTLGIAAGNSDKKLHEIFDQYDGKKYCT